MDHVIIVLVLLFLNLKAVIAIPALWEFLRNSTSDEPRPPVFLIPGLISSRLIAWKKKSCRGPDINPQDIVWLNLQKMIETITFDPHCWIDCMKLGVNGTDPPDCKLRSDEGLGAIGELSPGNIFSPATSIFTQLIKLLAEELGYDDDWRLAPVNLEERDSFYTTLKFQLETSVRRHRRPAIIMAHSMGALHFLYFIEWLRVTDRPPGGYKKWLRRHIWAFVGYGAPLLGAPISLKSVLSGHNFGLSFSEEQSRGLHLTCPSSHFLNPRISQCTSPSSSSSSSSDSSLNSAHNTTDISTSSHNNTQSKGFLSYVTDSFQGMTSWFSQSKNPTTTTTNTTFSSSSSSSSSSSPSSSNSNSNTYSDFDSTMFPEDDTCISWTHNDNEPIITVKNQYNDSPLSFNVYDVDNGEIFHTLGKAWNETLLLQKYETFLQLYHKDKHKPLHYRYTRPPIRHVIMIYGVDLPTEIGYVYRQYNPIETEKNNRFYSSSNSNSTSSGNSNSGNSNSEKKEAAPKVFLEEIIYEEPCNHHSMQYHLSKPNQTASSSSAILNNNTSSSNSLNSDIDVMDTYVSDSSTVEDIDISMNDAVVTNYEGVIDDDNDDEEDIDIYDGLDLTDSQLYEICNDDGSFCIHYYNHTSTIDTNIDPDVHDRIIHSYSHINMSELSQQYSSYPRIVRHYHSNTNTNTNVSTSSDNSSGSPTNNEANTTSSSSKPLFTSASSTDSKTADNNGNNDRNKERVYRNKYYHKECKTEIHRVRRKNKSSMYTITPRDSPTTSSTVGTDTSTTTSGSSSTQDKHTVKNKTSPLSSSSKSVTTSTVSSTSTTTTSTTTTNSKSKEGGKEFIRLSNHSRTGDLTVPYYSLSYAHTWLTQYDFNTIYDALGNLVYPSPTSSLSGEASSTSSSSSSDKRESIDKDKKKKKKSQKQSSLDTTETTNTPPKDNKVPPKNEYILWEDHVPEKIHKRPKGWSPLKIPIPGSTTRSPPMDLFYSKSTSSGDTTVVVEVEGIDHTAIFQDIDIQRWILNELVIKMIDDFHIDQPDFDGTYHHNYNNNKDDAKKYKHSNNNTNTTTTTTITSTTAHRNDDIKIEKDIKKTEIPSLVSNITNENNTNNNNENTLENTMNINANDTQSRTDMYLDINDQKLVTNNNTMIIESNVMTFTNASLTILSTVTHFIKSISMICMKTVFLPITIVIYVFKRIITLATKK